MFNNNKQEPVEPGDAPRIGFGHRKVYLLYCQSYVTDKVQNVKTAEMLRATRRLNMVIISVKKL
jgi:hypothetical protein